MFSRHPAETPITADELKLFRVEHHLTQARMAEMMGLSLRAYQDLENGNSPIRLLHERALDGVIAMLPDTVSTAPHVRLLQWRLHKGISVEEVAKSARVMPQVIKDIEAGRSGYTMRLLQRASRALEVPFEVMIGQSPSGQDSDLLDVWDAIPPDRKDAALRMLRSLME